MARLGKQIGKATNPVGQRIQNMVVLAYQLQGNRNPYVMSTHGTEEDAIRAAKNALQSNLLNGGGVTNYTYMVLRPTKVVRLEVPEIPVVVQEVVQSVGTGEA